MKPLASSNRSPRRLAAAGVVAATLTVTAAAGCAELDSPAGGGTQAPASSAPPASATPPVGADEYTQERSDAFWGAGYYMEDAFALSELWGTDLLEAKGRAGQLLLDGKTVPVAPGSTLDLDDPQTVAMLQAEAYWDAGYTNEDGEAMAALWHVDVYEAKSIAGQKLFDGQTLPIPPSGTPATS